MVNDKKRLFFIFRIFISLTLLSGLFWLMRGRLDNLSEILKSVKPGFFFAGLFVNMLVVIWAGLRIRLLFLVHKINFNLEESIRLVLIAQFFNNFLPSTVGGDVVKVYYAKHRSGGMLKPFSAVFIDRLIGMASLVFLASVSLLLRGDLIKNSGIKIAVAAMSVIFLALVLFFSNDTIAGKLAWVFKNIKIFNFTQRLKEIYKAVAVFRQTKQLWWAGLFALCTHISVAVGTYLLALSLSLQVPLFIFFVLMPVIGVLSNLPSLNGLGVREGAFVYVFGGLLKPEMALALSILFLSQLIVISLLGGITYLFTGGLKEGEVAV
ncbi:MAG: flippase-like domain-containing protein [Candidatus Omnitrophica bacterium]|nr:flippase-like domain-containing protein [Candidatus Omnitrophota bacterium]MBU1924690.1 flippase-like domain-containing protein [Candidatus Omnitrophota bacterium]